MDPVTLVLTVCLATAPEKCREETLQFQDLKSLNQCMFQSAVYIAEWSEQHPALRVKKWRCRVADASRPV
jgi:hypothetical protein